MARGARITAKEWVAYQRARHDGLNRPQAANRAGISERSAERFDWKPDEDTKEAAEWRLLWQQEQLQESMRFARERSDLEEGSPAVRALDDIELFARRYFGIILRPWQRLAAERIIELYNSDDEEYVAINVAPGSGKTTFFCKILPAWITARDRAVRGLMGSHVQRLADMNVRQLKRELERTVPIKAEPKELAMGLAVDAVATLASEYGNFKPENPEMWRGDTFIVAQPGDVLLTDKEPTWSAFGVDTGFLGFRYDFIIWDDAYDRRKMRTAEAREELRKWWDDTAETRLEPGGLLILQGQRLSAEDIYRYALDKVRFLDTDADELIEAGPKYHHVKFKAHDDDNCTGDHRRDGLAWPDGCLLDPKRLPYSKLRGIKQHDAGTYEVVYQQGDMDLASTLVHPIWVSGGVDAEGIDHPGCWDNERDLWELPQGLPEPVLMVATADPSPTKFWSIQCWAICLETQYRYLLECYRQQMDAPSFLDWNHAERRFTGIAEEWWQITRDMGRPITHWIVEANAAQKFILQYDHFRRWASLRGVQLIPHYTHARNKTDPDYGVWMLAQQYRYGRVRLPGKQNTYARPHSLLLVNEATHWTPEREHLQTDDCVMAQWFLEHNLENLRPPNPVPTTLWRPSWIRNKAPGAIRGRGVALR
jgi:hypothetical protein